MCWKAPSQTNSLVLSGFYAAVCNHSQQRQLTAYFPQSFAAQAVEGLTWSVNTNMGLLSLDMAYASMSSTCAMRVVSCTA